MRRRINIILPDETVRLIDRVAARGDRSRFTFLKNSVSVISVGHSYSTMQMFRCRLIGVSCAASN